MKEQRVSEWVDFLTKYAEEITLEITFEGRIYKLVLPEDADEIAGELEALRADAERWRAVSAMMTHEHRADAVGWTLGALLPGDDPDAALDATLTQEDHND